MPFDNLELDVENGVGRITLGRPQAAHALDLPLCRDLMHATIELDVRKPVDEFALHAAGLEARQVLLRTTGGVTEAAMVPGARPGAVR